MKKSIILIALFYSVLLHSQNNVSYTQSQYLDDFSYLVDSVILKSYPKGDAIYAVTGQNVYAEIEKLREVFDDEIGYSEFLDLVQKALRMTGDAHSGIQRGNGVKRIYNYLSEEEQKGLLKHVDTAYLHIANEHYNNYYSNITKWVKDFQFFIYVQYINGNYYNIVPIKTKLGTIEKGSVITQVNDIDIHEWVNNHLYDYPFQCYDMENKRFYATYQIVGKSLILNHKNIKLTFSQSGKDIEHVFKLSERPKFKKERWLSVNVATVKYFKPEKVLYIRLFRMGDSKPYLAKIRKYGKRKKIDKVIIDIRENYGGSDLVWKEIVEELIDKPFSIDIDVVSNNTGLVRDYYGLDDNLDIITFQDKQYLKFDSRMLETYIPSSTSIGFTKKIVLLQNKSIFSSAGAFFSMASTADKFITVGNKIDLPIGLGTTPMYIMLPNTKLVLRLDPTLDITNASNYNSLYRNVDVPVQNDVESVSRWVTKNGSRWNRRFLLKKDPYFQKAMEVKLK